MRNPDAMLSPAASFDARVPAIVWLIPNHSGAALSPRSLSLKYGKRRLICREMSRGRDSNKTNCFALLLKGSTFRRVLAEQNMRHHSSFIRVNRAYFLVPPLQFQFQDLGNQTKTEMQPYTGEV
jgi:hypothetical protein